MASKVINRSKALMDVLVSTTGGERIVRLEPGQQNNATVTPRAVRPTSSFDRLMGDDEWLEILTDIAVVYHWENIAAGFMSSASLHCVPFIPVGPGPFTAGYQPLVPEPNALAHEDPQPVENAPPADPRDGEFNMGAQTGDSLLPFGEYVRTKVGATTYISVRLILRRLDASASQIAQIKPDWKSEIESVWNSAPTSSTGQKYCFEVDWTHRVPHSSVFVRDTFVFPLFESRQRANMFLWHLTMGTGSRVTKVAAHEFGHHLGLSDGYHYQGEIPHLVDVMIKTSPLLKGKTVSPSTWTYVWERIGGSITATRAAERIKNGGFPRTGQENVMMSISRYRSTGTHLSAFRNDTHRDHVSSVVLIDWELIDAIETQTLQKLYLDENDFLRHESYHDNSTSYDGYYDANLDDVTKSMISNSAGLLA